MESTQQVEAASGGAMERAVVRSEEFLRSAPKPAIWGAVAGVLALGFFVRRANTRRRKLNGERGDTVVGVIVKGALAAAISTVPKVYFLRLAKAALHRQAAPTLRAVNAPMAAPVAEPSIGK